MDDEAAPARESVAMAGYDFHDPSFVTWWLNSLYLFPPADQMAIAQRLHAAVHAPAAKSEIEAFLELQRRELAPHADPDGPEPAPDLEPQTRAGWRLALRQAWRARPWWTGIGVVAAALFAVKGFWFLLRVVLVT